MRKKYQKPKILLEHFELTQQIASCGGIKINFNNAACVLNAPGATNQMKDLAMIGFFSGYENGCAMVASDGYAVCFHTNVNMVFTS